MTITTETLYAPEPFADNYLVDEQTGTPVPAPLDDLLAETLPADYLLAEARIPDNLVATDLVDGVIKVAPLLARSGLKLRAPQLAARVTRPVVHRFMRGIEGGVIELVEDGHVNRFESRSADRYGRADLKARVQIHDPRFYVALATGGSTGLGDAYRLGWFDTDDLPSLLRLSSRAYRRFEPGIRRAHRVTAPALDPIRRLRGADVRRDRKNIAAHYDLGNPFFELFLDDTLTYSSGLFQRPDSTMADASIAKIDQLCCKLRLRPGQRIVEIGTGWGAFAIHAAAYYGVEVVTTTLSAEQYRTAKARVAEAGLEDRIDVRLDHYRDLEGQFDAVVAVEMIEAVDWRELDDFLAHCARLLGPSGVLGLQAIVAPPARHLVLRSSRDFIKNRIFPGGSLPSVQSILDAAVGTDLIPSEFADFGLHYAETLRRWRHRLDERRAEAVALGLDESFLRLWEFYFAYCEAGFEERLVSVAQIILERPGRAASLVRQPAG